MEDAQIAPLVLASLRGTRRTPRTAGPGVASSNSSNPPHRWSWRRFVELVEPPWSSPPRVPAPSTPQSNTTSPPSPSVSGLDGSQNPEFSDLSPSLPGYLLGVSLTEPAYSKIVHWKRNIFAVHSGALGKRFVNELARLFRAYADASVLEGVALCAAMVMPALLLQCPRHSKTRVNKACLERRLHLWEVGDIHSLLHEGRCIQQRLPRR